VVNISQEAIRYTAEDLQVVRYEGSIQKDRHGFYERHADYFTPDEDTDSYFAHTGSNRFATILIYLNDVEAGGETEFLHSKLRVNATKGTMLLFYSMLPDGNLDEKSRHQGNPVLKGRKWISNLWLWDERREVPGESFLDYERACAAPPGTTDVNITCTDRVSVN